MVDTKQKDAASVIQLLGNRLHVERTKAQEQLRTGLKDSGWASDRGTMSLLLSGTKQLLMSDVMEEKLGGLIACPILLSYNEDLAEYMIFRCQQCLEDPEVRVRMAVGDALGTLARHYGVKVFEDSHGAIFDSIRRNFSRKEDEEDGVEEEDLLDDLLESTYKQQKPGTGDFRHGTEGWKCLETSFRALTKVIEACGAEIHKHVDEKLVDLVFEGTVHLNRFVREISFATLGAICSLLGRDRLDEIVEDVATCLAKGLSDDWSQVRYSASKSTRKLMEVIEEVKRVEFYPRILPQMCLNRYYVAEGVRIYSQETWRIVVGENGRSLVAQFAPYFADFYIRQCGANNHAVREAACACIAELMTKIEPNSIREFVPRLLGVLVNCFKDASWPVRDAACEATGKCVMAFPEESREVLDELYDLWFAHIWDNISSVREDSAIALGNVVRAYGKEAVDRILPVLRSMVLSAKDQPKESVKFSTIENTTIFGVAAMRNRANDEGIHTNQQMFSCGSLAPKLARGGGCMDHGFTRQKEPWEASDGSMYLVRELSAVASSACEEFFPAMVELSKMDGFTHAHNLRVTVWNVLPVIAKNLGKRTFKTHLECFLPSLFNSLKSSQQLEEVAAGNAIGAIRDYIGPGIFRGRLEDRHKAMLDSSPSIPPPSRNPREVFT